MHEVELLLPVSHVGVGLVVLVDDPVARLAGPGVHAESLDPEVVPDWPEGRAAVVHLADLVEPRNRVAHRSRPKIHSATSAGQFATAALSTLLIRLGKTIPDRGTKQRPTLATRAGVLVTAIVADAPTAVVVPVITLAGLTVDAVEPR